MIGCDGRVCCTIRPVLALTLAMTLASVVAGLRWAWDVRRGRAARTAADTMATGLQRGATIDELDRAERAARAWRQARDGVLR